VIDALERQRAERRKQDDDRDARTERAAERAAIVGRMRDLYASGDRSSAEMLSLRDLAQRGGMSSSEIDHALVDHGDDDAPAETVSAAPTAAPWMQPVTPPAETRAAETTMPQPPASTIVLAPKGTLGTTKDSFLQSLRVAPGVDARLAELNKLHAVATDPGQHARSAQSYVDDVAAGHVPYTKTLMPEDVKQFAVSGTLPDVVDPSGAVVTSGADRLATLATEARHGNWPAANTLVMLIDARRSALAAERGALSEKLKSAAPSDCPSIEAALATNHAADADLVTLRNHTHTDVTQANERFASSEVRGARANAKEATAARTCGDEKAAAALDAKAAARRGHAAKVAYDEARFRAGSAGLGLRRDGLLETSAEAQIDRGRAEVEAMHRSGALTETPPASLGDTVDAGHGVPGAKRLLDAATAAGGKGHAPLALENERQSTLAAFHKEHLDRAGFSPAKGPLTPSLAAHRSDYLTARGAQVKALNARDQLYVMTKPRLDEEMDAARVREEKRDALVELGTAAGRVETTEHTLADARAALAALRSGLSRQETERADANARADAADGPVLAAMGEDASGMSIRVHNDVENASAVGRNAQETAYTAGQRADSTSRDVAQLERTVASLEQEAPNVAADAERARAVLATTVPLPGATPATAAAAARREADLSAAGERASLDRVEAAHPSESTRIELARARTGLAGYYVGASADRTQTSALDNARAQIDRSDKLRTTVPLGDARDALAVDAIRVRGGLAETEALTNPNDARRDLALSERSLHEIVGNDASGEARAFVGRGAVSSLTRAEQGITQRRDFANYGRDEDALYGQAHRMLDGALNGSDPTVVAARRQLAQIDNGIAAVSQIVGSSRSQIARGVDVAIAQVGVTGRDEAAIGRAAVSNILSEPGIVPTEAIDDATAEAEHVRAARIRVDAAGADAELAAVGDAWSDAVRDGHAFETLGRLRAAVGADGRAATLVGDAPLLGALRQPVMSLATVADKYGAPSTAAFTSGARDAMLDAAKSEERSAATAKPLVYANLVGNAIVGEMTIGAVNPLKGIGPVAEFALGAGTAGLGMLTRAVFGTESSEAKLVEFLENFVPMGGGEKAVAKATVQSVVEKAVEKTAKESLKEAATIGLRSLALTVATERVSGWLRVESEAGQIGIHLALVALASVGPGALRLARTTAGRILDKLPTSEAVRSLVHEELETFAKKTQNRVATRPETEQLKLDLYEELGVSDEHDSRTEPLRARIDAEVEALALSRAPVRALAEMGVRPGDLTPEQAKEAVGRTADLIERARGLSSDAARSEAIRALRPVLIAAGVVPAVLAATESDAEAAKAKPTPGRVFALAKGVHKAASAAIRDLVRMGRSSGEPAEEIAKSLRITTESATHLASFLRSPEMASLPEIARALDRQQPLSAAQSATLGRLQTELQQVTRLPLPSDPGERATFAAEQRTPSGKHWAAADLSFEEFQSDYRAHVGGKGALSDADLHAAYDAGNRLNPETGELSEMRGKAVYATATDVVLTTDLPAPRQATVNAAFQEREAAERDLRAAERRPDLFSQSDVDALRGKLTVASRRFGEASADAYVEARFPGERTLLWPTDDVSRSGDFDRIYRVQGADGRPKYLLVEAKGGSADLGDCNVSGGRADQGTKRYMDTIVLKMANKPASKALALDLKHSTDDVIYFEVKAPVEEPLAIHAREFDVTIDTGVRTK
jgi:hypothetical protein